MPVMGMFVYLLEGVHVRELFSAKMLCMKQGAVSNGPVGN